MNFPSVTLKDVQDFIVKETYTVLPDGRTTICQLTLKNGFTVEGQSACVSIENFDSVKGNMYARERAESKVWEHLGFDLSTKVNLIKGAGEPTGDIAKVPGVRTYIGTKVVRAVPYTLKQYNDLRGWDVPKDMDPKEEGYLIEYVDGGQPNVFGFTGYISWSPADVFKRAYTLGVEVNAETFIDRLNIEHSQLSERIKKDSSFVGSAAFYKLPVEDQDDLVVQLDYMNRYNNVLRKRIKKLS